MIERNETPIILNLAGSLSRELASYFEKKGFRVVNPLVESAVLEWTHIIVRDIESFDKVGDIYNTVENNIKIISLSMPSDLKNFMINNGKLVIDETWLNGDFGNFLLDKFFQEYGGVSLSDNYPKFQEHGTFNIANPFSTGEYLDHLVHHAFKSGMNALSIKTYFDHILMYLTALKNTGRIGFPIGVSYGTYEDTYALQMHFYAENLQIEDVTNYLTSSITKTPEEYLLHVTLRSSDFFDLTYLPETKKLVITGLWTKNEKIITENKGMMLSHSMASTVNELPETLAATPFVLNEGKYEDLSALVTHGEKKQIVSSKVPDEEVIQIIPAGGREEEVLQIIPDSKKEEVLTRVSGSPIEEETLSIVKGLKEENQSFTKVSGNKEEKDDFKFTLSGTKEEKKGSMSVRSLAQEVAKGPGMFDFAHRHTVKDTVPDLANSKKGMSLFNVSGPTNREKELELQLKDTQSQNDQLKSKLKTVVGELKTQKETQALAQRAADAASRIAVDDDDLTKLEEIMSMEPSRELSERETRMAEEFQQMEKLTKKMQLETSQKESFFNQEIEKLQRLLNLKEFMIEKTRETTNRALEMKDQDISRLHGKLDQANKYMAGGGANAQTNMIKELERQALNQNKLIEMYKVKISNMSASIDSGKGDDASRDETKKLLLSNAQMKTQIESMRKELTRLQDRAGAETTQMMSLKQDKLKLTEALRKAEQAARASQAASGSNQAEIEAKRLNSQVQLLENYLKESNSKVKELESRFQTASAISRNNTAAEDGQTKAKIGQLENSVKKLTQDLVESRNQLAEVKKETNKLRQEKTAIQNLYDKAKKDLEKSEKKPSSTKKAS